MPPVSIGDTMKIDRIANRDCRTYVQKRHAFEGSNLFALHRVVGTYPTDSRHYTVYSYDYHYPMFVYAGGRWFENADRYSVSTAKHRSQAHPHPDTETVKLSSVDIRYLDDHGFTKFAERRILEGVV
jgi:hypothetical protein